jgi:hypothetical protein
VPGFAGNWEHQQDAWHEGLPSAVGDIVPAVGSAARVAWFRERTTGDRSDRPQHDRALVTTTPDIRRIDAQKAEPCSAQEHRPMAEVGAALETPAAALALEGRCIHPKGELHEKNRNGCFCDRVDAGS